MSPTIRRTLLVMLTVAAGMYAVVHLRGPNGINALLEKRQAIRQMQEENRLLEAKVASEARCVEDIKAKKPEVIIPIIRARTNWVREGERDFRIEKDRNEAAPRAAPYDASAPCGIR